MSNFSKKIYKLLLCIADIIEIYVKLFTNCSKISEQTTNCSQIAVGASAANQLFTPTSPSRMGGSRNPSRRRASTSPSPRRCREVRAAPRDGDGEVLTQEGHELVYAEMALGGRDGTMIGRGDLGA
jgi:hypothetical protein